MNNNKTTLIDLILDASKQADAYHNTRNLYSVNSAVQAEAGELSEEVAIEMGDSYKEAGPDGIPGEAIDTIISVLDLLYINNHHISEVDLCIIAKPKLEKWIAKIKEANAKGLIK